MSLVRREDFSLPKLSLRLCFQVSPSARGRLPLNCKPRHRQAATNTRIFNFRAGTAARSTGAYDRFAAVAVIRVLTSNAYYRPRADIPRGETSDCSKLISDIRT